MLAPRKRTQLLSFPKRPRRSSPHARPPREKTPMLLQATEINYDYVNNACPPSATCRSIYSGTTLEADRVIYDENTKRLHAEGNVRLTEANGQITYGELMNLSDDFRDGFVDSLRSRRPTDPDGCGARRPQQRRFTVFQSGVYTACEPCKDDPKKAAALAGQGERGSSTTPARR